MGVTGVFEFLNFLLILYLEMKIIQVILHGKEMISRGSFGGDFLVYLRAVWSIFKWLCLTLLTFAPFGILFEIFQEVGYIFTGIIFLVLGVLFAIYVAARLAFAFIYAVNGEQKNIRSSWEFTKNDGLIFLRVVTFIIAPASLSSYLFSEFEAELVLWLQGASLWVYSLPSLGISMIYIFTDGIVLCCVATYLFKYHRSTMAELEG